MDDEEAEQQDDEQRARKRGAGGACRRSPRAAAGAAASGVEDGARLRRRLRLGSGCLRAGKLTSGEGSSSRQRLCGDGGSPPRSGRRTAVPRRSSTRSPNRCRGANVTRPATIAGTPDRRQGVSAAAGAVVRRWGCRRPRLGARGRPPAARRASRAGRRPCRRDARGCRPRHRCERARAPRARPAGSRSRSSAVSSSPAMSTP